MALDAAIKTTSIYKERKMPKLKRLIVHCIGRRIEAKPILTPVLNWATRYNRFWQHLFRRREPSQHAWQYVFKESKLTTNGCNDGSVMQHPSRPRPTWLCGNHGLILPDPLSSTDRGGGDAESFACVVETASPKRKPHFCADFYSLMSAPACSMPPLRSPVLISVVWPGRGSTSVSKVR